MIFDPTYFLFVGPAFLLSLWASFKTKSAFNKYSKVRASSGMTGAQAAQRLLDMANIHDVEVVPTRGMLSDHYNPMTKKLALSESVYDSPSVAAIGVACHEAGHAIQHSKGYKPLWLRSLLVPTAGIGSNFGVYAMLFGLILDFGGLFTLGVILFSAAVAFQVVTLPVEFDASSRAKKLAPQMGIVTGEREAEGVSKVLNAAALTYVAAALTSVMTLLYFLSRRN
ncbi:MAG: zinc metallopeptidase [Thermoanaerobaculia bacterium]|nr:zinc metallopeptidase [Thermoanaerobaculia bacterium]